MGARYQRGYLRLGGRKTGPHCCEFLWRDTESTGKRVRRKAVIGTVQQYPTPEDAWQASNGLRMSINEVRNCQREQDTKVEDLIDHYSQAGSEESGPASPCGNATPPLRGNCVVVWGKLPANYPSHIP